MSLASPSTATELGGRKVILNSRQRPAGKAEGAQGTAAKKSWEEVQRSSATWTTGKTLLPKARGRRPAREAKEESLHLAYKHFQSANHLALNRRILKGPLPYLFSFNVIVTHSLP